jgi:hypothetical protein
VHLSGGRKEDGKANGHASVLRIQVEVPASVIVGMNVVLPINEPIYRLQICTRVDVVCSIDLLNRWGRLRWNRQSVLQKIIGRLLREFSGDSRGDCRRNATTGVNSWYTSRRAQVHDDSRCCNTHRSTSP